MSRVFFGKIMATTPTQLPVPSETPRDLKFNAGKIDEFVTSNVHYYTDRFGKKHITMAGMHAEFDAQLASQEARFDAFIERSGYQVIGDYADGPLTITEYNQLIRYGNELWKLTAATDLPYTTAGTTDETWNATDSLHFVSVGDAALRQNLGSSEDGLGGDLVNTPYGLSVNEMLSFGRIVYPEMFGVGILAPTDDQLWSLMFSYLESLPDTLLGTSLSYTIDLRGKQYTLYESHDLDINVNIINGILLMNGGQIVLSREAAEERTRRIILKDLKVRYVGTTYYPDALIKVARCYNSMSISCDFWAGDTTATDGSGKPLRARYGLWLGSKRAWGCSIIGGEYFGGETPCRIGYTNDHTGISIVGGTYHHGWVGNLMLCNPAGFSVTGANIEHSENGAWGIGIASGTNADAGSTVINPAHGGTIEGCYFYNNGNGSTGSANTEAGVLIGYDLPGTLGWDYAGFLITSQNTAHSISVKNCYVVSPKQNYAIKMRGLFGLHAENNKVTCSVAGRAIHFSGTCARSHAYDNRNQSTGSVDEVTYDSTNKPMIGARAGTFNPSLTGSATAGVITYSTRGGNYEISNDSCKLSLWMTIGSITTQPAGNLSISLPIAIAPGQRSGAGVHCQVLLGNQTYEIHGVLDEDNSKTVTSTLNIPNRTLPVTCSVTSGTALNLFLGGQPMDGSVVRGTTDIRISIEYPVAGATYIGA
ncbi:hypothetical protein [Klebsiella aerogenes]|uniref:hypothetical protein n=1 Tax=Klebsiella aerogenes TaxID=548 RepID=UPI001BCA7110|nr:hypothetical protein [Klebsiella aerogenes]